MKKALFIAAILIISCGKNSDHHAITVPDVIQANNTRGNITGYIFLYDEDGTKLSDNGYVTVSIDNSTVSTTTDATGKFQLDSIPAGTYDISYTRDGFGTGKIMGLYHAATNHATTNITRNESMAMNSSLVISNVIVKPFDAALAQLGVTGFHIVPVFDNPGGKEKWVHLFFADNPNVSFSNFQGETKIKASGTATEMNNFNLTTAVFESFGFSKGQTIYIKSYGDSFLADAYTNPLTNQTIFPSLSTSSSPVVSFVIPMK